MATPADPFVVLPIIRALAAKTPQGTLTDAAEAISALGVYGTVTSTWVSQRLTQWRQSPTLKPHTPYLPKAVGNNPQAGRPPTYADKLEAMLAAEREGNGGKLLVEPQALAQAPAPGAPADAAVALLMANGVAIDTTPQSPPVEGFEPQPQPPAPAAVHPTAQERRAARGKKAQG